MSFRVNGRTMKFCSREIYYLIPWAREKLKDGQFLKINLERPEASSNKQVTLQAKENAHMAPQFSLLLLNSFLSLPTPPLD